MHIQYHWDSYLSQKETSVMPCQSGCCDVNPDQGDPKSLNTSK